MMRMWWRSKKDSNQGGGLLSPNVATNVAIFLGRLMKREAVTFLSDCICLILVAGAGLGIDRTKLYPNESMTL